MNWEHLAVQVVSTIVFSLIGVVFFGAGVWIFLRVAKIPFHKEIGDNHNVALAVLLGSLMLAIAIIIASVVHG
jgi:putative membrane protein